jgi:exoribonuclease-2
LTPRVDSLVLYKGQPAVVRQVADKKLTIESLDGGQISVRPKDVALLHLGPSPHPRQLPAVNGDPQTAWELLDGGKTTLAELAELSFGDYTPATAWATWQLVADGVYFEGAPDAVTAHTAERVAEIQAARAAKAAEERDWEAFVARAGAGRVALDDERYLTDVIALALGRSESSRTLRRLGRAQTSEVAHDLLLSIGRWLPADNPYPARQNVTTRQPDLSAEPLPDEPRRDLTHLLALAIDDEGSGDPDDAISPDGERLWVHVADVAAVVATDSLADVEARGRAANLYLPEGTVRMLPDELTDRLALGLQPVSPALSFALAPLSDGDFELLEIVPSWIRATRATYEAAETQLAESPYRELLAIADRNRARRLAGGAIEIELPEVKIKAGVDGAVVIRPLPPLRSRELVREAMLMAGEAVGRLGQATGLPLAYTVQDPPQEGELSPGDLAGAGPSTMWAQRRLMQRSRPSTSPGRHAGLGLDVYVQVTSPLRRYLDLLAHQQLRAHLRGEAPLDVAAVTLRIGTADAIAGAVRAAERLSNQHWTLVYLMQHADWQGEGIVVENKPGRDVVLIPELAWEAEIYRRPARPLDSVVTLAIESVDLPNRTARFKVL